MKIKTKIETCRACMNRGFNPSIGLICQFSKEKPDYNTYCPNYEADKSVIANKQAQVNTTGANDMYLSFSVALILLIGFIFIYFTDLFRGDIDAGIFKYCIFIIISGIPIKHIHNTTLLKWTFFISGSINIAFLLMPVLATVGDDDFWKFLAILVGIFIFYAIGYLKVIKKAK